MKSLVTKVMRVFVDAYPHVPEHRRLPVFVHLLTILGPSNYVHVCLALLLEKISNKEAKVSPKIVYMHITVFHPGLAFESCGFKYRLIL